MKRLLIVLTVLLSQYTNSQTFKNSEIFIDFGPKVMIGPSLMNSNVSFDTTSRYSHKFNSHGFNWGAKFAINFGQHVSAVGEYIVTNNTQNFQMDDGSTKSIKSKGFEIPLMIRHNNENFGYLETGVVLSRTRSVLETSNLTGDYTNLYLTKNTGFVFGIGGYLFSAENFGVSAGLRFRYDFKDFVTDSNLKYTSAPIYALDSDIEKTNNMSLMFVLEFNYDLGFAMARSACGQRRKVMFSSGRR
jgi:hypothetical protein